MKALWDSCVQLTMNTAGLLEIHYAPWYIHLLETGFDQITGQHQPKRLHMLSEANGRFKGTMISNFL